MSDTEERLAELERRLAHADDGYFRVPKWIAGVMIGVVVAALVMLLFTFPASPLAQSPTPRESAASTTPAPAVAQGNSVPAGPVTLPPLGLTSAMRTLGDPNAKIALVEYGDFQ